VFSFVRAFSILGPIALVFVFLAASNAFGLDFTQFIPETVLLLSPALASRPLHGSKKRYAPTWLGLGGA